LTYSKWLGIHSGVFAVILIDSYLQNDKFCIVLQGVVFKLTKTEANNLHTALGKMLDDYVEYTREA